MKKLEKPPSGGFFMGKLRVYTEICTIHAMKTTLNINDALLRDAKVLAAQQHTSLTHLIEEGLQLRMRKAGSARGTERAHLRNIPVFHGRGGLVPGLNAKSNRAFLEAMEAASPT